jgi:hypothetical protein
MDYMRGPNKFPVYGWLVLALGLAGVLWSGEGQCFPLNEKAAKKKEATKAWEAEIEKKIYEILQEDHEFRGPKLPWVLYIRDVRGRRLVDPIFKRRDGRGANYDVIAFAKEGEIKVDLKARTVVIQLRKVTVLHDKAGKKGKFEERKFLVPIPSFPKRDED